MNKLKKGIIKRAALLSVVGLIFGSATIPFVSAQDTGVSGNGFRISPVRSELTVEKGESSKLDITIENPTEFSTVAKPIINNFVASDKENGEPLLILEETADAPANDFKSLVGDISEITLGPKEKRDISVNISVPQDARSGGYYGAVRFIPSATNDGGNISLTASVGTIVLVTVPGDLTQKLDLVEFGASRDGVFKGFFTSGEVAIATRLKNSGDIHVQPFGKVIVKDMFGKTVSEYEINSAKGSILPDSTRRFEDSIGKPKGVLGRYTAEVNVGYSQGSGDLVYASASFWYVPVWAIITLVGLVVLLVVGVYVLIRKRNGKARR